VFAAIERAPSLLIAISTIAGSTCGSRFSRNSGLYCATYATCATVVAQPLCWIIATPAVTSFIAFIAIACACALVAYAFRCLRQ
jgi:hypothetical protein